MVGNEDNPQIVARVFFWIGAVGQSIFTVIKFGEWIGRRMEIEHVHPQWIMIPVRLSVAAMVAPMVPMFAADSDQAKGTIYLARFFQSFALFMFLVLFVITFFITFFKVITGHNSDTRLRYGIFIWLAATPLLGIADFLICFTSKSPTDKNACVDSFANYYFVSLWESCTPQCPSMDSLERTNGEWNIGLVVLQRIPLRPQLGCSTLLHYAET